MSKTLSLREKLAAAQKAAEDKERKESEEKTKAPEIAAQPTKPVAQKRERKPPTPQGEKKVDLISLLADKSFVSKLAEALGITNVLTRFDELQDINSKYLDLQGQIERLSKAPEISKPPEQIIKAIAKIAQSNKKRVAKTSLKIDINTLLEYAGLPLI